MNPFTCSVQPCNATKYEALGMCRLHYRRSRPRKPDAKVAMPCDGCGKTVLKEKRTRRYATVQCDDALCRQWLTFGTAAQSKLPADHWAILYEATCEWSAPVKVKPKPRVTAHFECAWCGEGFESSQAAARYCTDKCSRKRRKVARRAREHNARGTFTWAEIVGLWMRFDKACAYCAAPTSLVDIQAEHVIALSKGGRNDLSNLLPSCALCNSDKSAHSLIEWSALRSTQGKPPVSTTWTWSDARYRHLALPLAAV